MKPHSPHLRSFPAVKATLAALCLAGLIITTASATIMIDYVPVGNAGNPNDSTGYGGVSYDYNIGQYEVTLSQYTGFLNAVAATDTNSLYNASMGTDLNIAGITRSGISGSYTYAVAGDGNRPVTYVSLLDGMRFANWLGNGRPTGAQNASTTEGGAYTMSLGGFAPRNAGATVFVPSENEWYKSAYYDPTIAAANKYWLYPTQSNALPGNNIGGTANQANIYDDVRFSVTQSGVYNLGQDYLTPVGAFTASASFYETFDQGGNVFEWNESRGLRGAAWGYDKEDLRASNRYENQDPSHESGTIGFRLASIEPIPEPGTALFGLACLGVAALRRRWPAAV
jgi:formylglycine-generating enzyme required for sulfatase activity